MAIRRSAMNDRTGPFHISLIAIPEAMAGTLTGIFDSLNSIGALGTMFDGVPDTPPFQVEIVGERAGPVMLASGMAIEAGRGIDDIDRTDLVIVPSLLAVGGVWEAGRHSGLVDWVSAMHERGAVLCSACSGIFVLAETGLFDGHEATIHWGYADGFRKAFPTVRLFPERALVAAGDREQFVSCGAATSWHDLVLYLVSRWVGPTTAHAIAKFYAMQWHVEGVAPYIVFDAPTGHGDAVIEDAQQWLATHYSVAAPVEELVRRSGLSERSFKRRFSAATGFPPIAYVQRLRVEEAKRLLERTEEPVDEVSWRVGYEDPAFFRRLFKRTTGLSPGAYRRRFRMPRNF
jgi:transcriptional regulator GlxA family with amidase domain